MIGDVMTQIIPLPKIDITTRIATMDDLEFIDQLQKAHHRELGFFPRAQMEGYIKNQWVIIAEGSGQCAVGSGQMESSSLPTAHCLPPTLLGYCASRDRYLKRDELGAIFQLCVAPKKQRGLIGANLLRAVFEGASYGTKLYCCWCAQDLEASYFWEAMGFVPLAFRTGSRTKGKNAKPRVHIFWEKRVRAGDEVTPWWFPSQTGGGAIREDRLVLPIPPGLTWSDEMPVLLPIDHSPLPTEPKRLPGPRAKKLREIRPGPCRINMSRLNIGADIGPARKARKTGRSPRAKAKHDPKHIAAARELRDRYLEQVNDQNLRFEPHGKYEVSRVISAPKKSLQLEAA
jgi:hypothetical protein